MINRMSTLKPMIFVCFLVLLCANSCCEAQHAPRQRPSCARTCHEVECHSTGIRYGKYCGVGHGGCPGEQPCDAADACCKKHDECVEKKGLLDANSCHRSFIRCLNKVEKTGTQGFSGQCPYSVVIPTMRQGIELAMAMTSMFSGLQGNVEL